MGREYDGLIMPTAEKKVLDPDRPLWERQDTESSGAYEAFLMYRNMERRALTTMGSGAAEMSVRWSWGKRCLEWDRHLAREEAIALVRDRVTMNERHRRMSRVALQKLSQWIVNVDPTKLKPAEAARWFEIAVRVEREATGANLTDAHIIPTFDEKVRNPLDDMSMAELLGVEEGSEHDALREMYERVKAQS